jgi:hypothetical protein
MKKVKLFVCADMTVINCGESPNKNLGGYSYYEVIANVVSIKERTFTFYDGREMISYDIQTDFCNPYRSVCSKFSLNKENFDKVQWIE